MLLALLIVIGADATHWRNRTASLERSIRPEIRQQLEENDGPYHQSQSEEGIKITDWAIVVLAALQAWIYWRQARTMSHQAEIAEKQTSLIALQTDLLERQKEIARQGHLATHRPRLTVRNIVLKPEPHQCPGAPIVAGYTASGQLYVVNRGGSEAWIIDALIMIHVEQKADLPMERPYEGNAGNIGCMKSPLLAGKSIPIKIQSLHPLTDQTEVRILEGKGGGDLYVMGWVEYRDGSYDIRSDTQLTRRTAFCRKFDVGSERFVRVQNDDYEYEE